MKTHTHLYENPPYMLAYEKYQTMYLFSADLNSATHAKDKGYTSKISTFLIQILVQTHFY